MSCQEEQFTNNITIPSTLSNKRPKHSSSTITINDDTNNNYSRDQPHSFTFNESAINNNEILKIATHNVRSLCSPLKQQLLIQTIENYKIDIMDIAETNLAI